MTTAILAAALLLAVFFLSLFLFSARTQVGKLRGERAEAEEALKAEIVAMQSLERELGNALAEAHEHKRRADSYFEMIDGVVGEATTVRELYQTMAVRHGNAQALMLNQISSLHRQYIQLVEEFRSVCGKPPRRPKPQLDPRIEAVAKQYQEEHIDRPLEMPRTEAAEQSAPT